MKGLLLSLGLVALFALCAVCAQSDIPVQPDFQDDKIVGKWYSIAMASNSNWFQSKKQYMKMCTTVITPTADGSLEVVSTYPKMDRCDQRTMTYIKTDQPGRFRSKNQRSGGDYDISVVETNYKEYVLMSMRKTKGTNVYTMVTLFGRDKELRTELLDKFRNFSLEQGLGEDNILILPQTDQCMTEA
ncbi:lipocalin-like isoform X1 [Ascaphus truei]|uniref:lipocalin-like isoform X1 n=1 Tax=Ascaphus truei TaxID=8439 RepID=UPI003F59687E